MTENGERDIYLAEPCSPLSHDVIHRHVILDISKKAGDSTF